MGNNKITHEESISIITEMISMTRTRMERKFAYPFLVWGISTCTLSIIIHLLLVFTSNPAWQWLWWSLPLIGFGLIALKPKSHIPQPKTFIDKILEYLWLLLAIVAIVFSGISMFNPIFGKTILMIIAVFMGVGTAMTGIILKYKTLSISAYTSLAFSLSMIIAEPKYQLLLFACVFFVMMVIPGFIITRQFKK